MRPLISTGDPKKSVDISRKAELYETSSGMITITGGKLTTWRRMAKMTVDRLVEREARDAPCRTHEIPLGQAIAVEELPRVEGVPEDVLRGARRAATATPPTRCSRSPPSAASWRSRSSPGCPTCWPRWRSPRAASRRAASATCCCAAPASGCWPRASWRRGRRAPDGARRCGASATCSRASWAGSARALGAELERFAEEARAEGIAASDAARPRSAARRRRAAGAPRARVRPALDARAGRRPLLMGIVNASPDSFSDGGAARDARRAGARSARELLGAGADILDIGGESASTGRPPVEPSEEIERVVPLIERVAGELGAIVSVDTYKPRGRARRDRRRRARSSTTSAACATPSSRDVCARDRRGARA